MRDGFRKRTIQGIARQVEVIQTQKLSRRLRNRPGQLVLAQIKDLDILPLSQPSQISLEVVSRHVDHSTASRQQWKLTREVIRRQVESVQCRRSNETYRPCQVKQGINNSFCITSQMDKIINSLLKQEKQTQTLDKT